MSDELQARKQVRQLQDGLNAIAHSNVSLTDAERELLLTTAAAIEGHVEAFAAVVSDKAELKAQLAHTERNHRNTLDLIAQWGDLLRELKHARPLMLYGDEWITRIRRALCEIV